MKGQEAISRPLRNRFTLLWLATAALLLFFFLSIDSLAGDTPTMDEQNHIARGLAFLRTGDPRLSLEHPPLINTLSALPLLTMPELRLPIDDPSWNERQGWYQFARLFMWTYNHDVERIVFLARLPMVALHLSLALVGFVFARRLWRSRAAALVALVLLLFEPNLLAHGRYATTDMGGVLFSFVATALLWSLWQRQDGWHWKRWLFVALGMGLTFGSKLIALSFAPVWMLLALLPIYPTTGLGFEKGYARRAARRVTQVALAGLASLPVIWAIFGFQWGNLIFISRQLSPLNGLRGPMPTYWAGLETALHTGSTGRGQAFLLGRFSETGFVSYFPAAFLMKTPVVLLALIALAAVLLIALRPTRRRAIFLLVPGLAYMGIVMFSALNIGYRHALPWLPYLLVLAAGLASPQAARIARTRLGPSTALLPRVFAGLGALLLVLATALAHPHYLSYFNLAAGGMTNGYRLLGDSNVDWGQDLLRLKTWMAENDIPLVKLGWFGTADPDYYGVAYEPLPGFGREPFFSLWWNVPFDPAQPEPGVYAISAATIWELPLRLEEKHVYEYFRAREPDATIGGAILIYVVK